VSADPATTNGASPPPDEGLRYDTVTFLSDYGTDDEFVGVVHSVIRQLAPGVTVIDLTHGVAPFDVRGGGLTLARSAQYLAPGVILAVVDPGVGSDRRAVAVEVAGGAAVLVGPDNGLLAGAVGMIGGAERAVVLDDPRFHLAAAGPTFDGRDVFAPVAAHLCLGVPLEEVGTLVDTSSLTPGLLPLSEATADSVSGEVLWVDRYGNAQLNVDPDDLDGWGERVELRVGEQRRSARRVRTVSDLGTGQIGLIVDSYGLVALVADRTSVADELHLAAGDPVVLGRLDDVDEGGAWGVTTTVQIGARSGGPTTDPREAR
jgi:S-adenosylmethionine hydrolase